LLEIGGRWSGLEQPNASNIRAATDDFHPEIEIGIDKSRELDIAFSYPDRRCFAFSNASYYFPQWRNPAYELTLM
jgi:hypothetical protein